jgi:DNA-binding NarL/FixJ family response regulator
VPALPASPPEPTASPEAGAAPFHLRVLVVDDEPLVRGLLGESLTALGHRVAQAGSAAEARSRARELDPDVALIDLDLGPGPNGFDLELSLRAEHPELRTVFLTNLPSPQAVGRRSRDVPADAGYLHKRSIADSAALADALRRAGRGEGGSIRHDLAAPSPVTDLSPTQLAVLRLVADGLSNADIAARRGTTERAVRMLVARTFRALGVDGTRPADRVRAALTLLRGAP